MHFMIDRTKKYWTGDSAEDISEWLRLYTEEDSLDVKPVICRTCGGDSFALRVDQNEGAVQVECPVCGTKKILLDCEEFWADARPKLRKCSVCKTGQRFNVRVGFVRRENKSVKWIYIGNRCTTCGTLGSFVDWKVDYEPTDRMEENL